MLQAMELRAMQRDMDVLILRGGGWFQKNPVQCFCDYGCGYRYGKQIF